MKHSKEFGNQSWSRGREVDHYAIYPTLSFKACRQSRKSYLDCRGGGGIVL